MRKSLVLLYCCIFMICCTGCKNPIQGRTEIDKILFVTAFGLDKISEGEDIVKITITAPRVVGTRQPGGEAQKEPHILTAQGRTVFEAFRKFRLFTDRKIFFGHTSFIIIGEEMAKSNLEKELDVLIRDHEMRLNSKIMVVKSHTAEDLIRYTKGNDEYIAKQLETLQENIGGISQSGKMELIKLMQALDNKDSAPYIPYITLHDNSPYPGLRSEDKDLYIPGYAIFKDAKLHGYIKNSEAKGFNWIKNQIESGYIIVKTNEGTTVTLEIIDSQTKLVPRIDNDKVSVLVKVKMSSNIAEEHGTENIFRESTLDFLEKQQNEVIKSEIKSAIAYAQNANADFLDIANKVRHKYPVKWESIKDKWEDVFPNIAFDIQIESRINRTYNVEQPSKAEGGK